MNAAECRIHITCEFLQGRDRLALLPLDDQPLRSEPGPYVRVRQCLDQELRARLMQCDLRRLLEAFRNNAPDAPSTSTLQVEALLDVVRKRQRGLDYLSIEIEHVNS